MGKHKTNGVPIQIRIDSVLKKWLKAEAARKGMDMYELINIIIRDYLKNK